MVGTTSHLGVHNPLALCTHKACLNATHSTDRVDTKIAWNDKGEMRLKQKTMTAGRDYYITTDDFTEIHENFICGKCKYLIMGENTEPGGGTVQWIMQMFLQRFSSPLLLVQTIHWIGPCTVGTSLRLTLYGLADVMISMA